MDKKVLRWNFVFQYGYMITTIIGTLILTPFYLKKIDAATLGVWFAATSIINWMTLLDPGTGEVLQQKIAEFKGRNLKDEISKTIGSGFMASAFILLISIIAGVVFYLLIGAIINKDVTRFPNLQIGLFISIVAIGFMLVSFGLSGINQGLHNVRQVAISTITGNILFVIVNILLLFSGYGIISIAFSNLCRWLFINIYNFFAVKAAVKLEGLAITFSWAHFKKFIRIFSFTSLASIIGGFSASMDVIFLARFIAPTLITTFEINKRPIQYSQSLVGRHSVALMPLISHAVGKNDKVGILQLINTQFKYYLYAVVFLMNIFIFNYRNLITTWTVLTGKGNFYAGSTIVYLLIANFFFGLIGYFMSNMGYALGDIKFNSIVNTSKGLVIGFLYYFAAKHYGIAGVLTVMLAGIIIVDFATFSFRLYRLGYLQKSLITNILGVWSYLIPVAFIIGLGCNNLLNRLIIADTSFIKLLLNTGIFAVFYIALLLVIDNTLKIEFFKIIKPKQHIML